MTASEVTETELTNEVVGIWDTNISPLSLGGLIILAEELKIKALVHQAKSTAIGIVGDQAGALLPGLSPQNGKVIILSSREACQGSGLLSVLMDLDSINVCYLSSTLEELHNFLQTGLNHLIIWPQLNEHRLISHKYSSTVFIQKFFTERGFIPRLTFKKDLLKWAISFTTQHITPSLPVVIHLKNNPNLQGCSNANFESWYNFFLSCYGQYDVRFILIGNELIDPQITQLPTVLVARDYGSNLTRDLALIQTSYIFMGMSSGPCNMAIFSDIPYIIYKNPDHDVEEMALEFGANTQFLFATPVQKFLRIFETPQGLISEFANLYTHINQSDWETRLAQWK